VRQFEEKNGGVRVKESDIFSSSKLAVAMEFLNLVHDPELKAYCASKDGILDLAEGLKGVLTLREFLIALPEGAEDGK